MTKTLQLTLALLAFAFLPLAHAKPPAPPLTPDQTAAIEFKVTEAMKKEFVPGLAVAIVKDGLPVYVKTWGQANLEHAIPVTPKTVFKVASVSKQMIAAGIVLLAQEGKLGLDDPVSKHLKNTPETWSGVTLRHLLNHSAGIVREGPAFDAYKPVPDRDVVASAYSQPLAFPTGTKTQYCNVCYFALAEIISTTSGQSWPAFIGARLFAPAGMKATRTTTTRELVPLRATGYEAKDGVNVPGEDYIAVRPSGAFLSTIEDMVAWEAFLHGGKVISPKSLAEMSSRSRLNDGSFAPFGAGGQSGYGLGFEISTLDGHARIHHGGALPGFRSHYGRYPDSGFAVIVLANGPLRAGVLEQAIARVVLPVLKVAGKD
ncbi:MAG: beta-lactamase family protein [Betaproteobacteria bacterium]|nr:beta-lactamase family protein [Betaproteobacteria bacterium]